MFLLTDLAGKFPRTEKLNDTKDVADVVIGITGSPAAGTTAEFIAASMTFGDEFTCKGSFRLRCVTDAEAETWTEEPVPAGLVKNLRDVIAAHNRMIETIQNAEMTCNLFRGMEVWHKIACEGADITHAARSIGIDAKVNMQTGVIYAEAGKQLSKASIPLAEIIRNLKDQAEDRDSSVDKDDPDCIFRKDAAVLRAAIDVLQKVEMLW